MNQTQPQTTTTQPKPSHTPSWEVFRDATPEDFPQFTLYREDGERMATAYTSEANAQLIAQAPALLAENAALREALEHALEWMEQIQADEPEDFSNPTLDAQIIQFRSLLK